MRDITVLGIDIAKRVFQLHGVDKIGNSVLKKRLSRPKFIEHMSQLPPCLIGLEACGGAHHWGRWLTSLGHQVKLMSPREVKAYVSRNKHDAADAAACCEAATRSHVKSVRIKTVEQQSLLLLHKTRQRLLKQRVQLSNHIRGMLYEFGEIIALGDKALKTALIDLMSPESSLTDLVRGILYEDYEEYLDLEKRITGYDQRIKAMAQSEDASRRLMTIPGIGPKIATAYTAILTGQGFTKGRQAAAWLGLTPKERSSGEKRQLGGITKQGNRYLRCLLIHGARAVVKEAVRRSGQAADATYVKSDKLSQWIQRLVTQRGYNKAVVALANKNARMAWAMLTSGSSYQADFAEHYARAA